MPIDLHIVVCYVKDRLTVAIPPLKHVVDQVVTNANISAAFQVFPICVGTINPNSYATATQCRNGSLVKKLTLQIDVVDLNGSGGAPNEIDWYIWFNIGGVQARVNPNLINGSVTKNQIFHQDGAMICMNIITAVGIEVPWVHKWRVEIMIPRSLQQINENDAIEAVFSSSVNAATTSIKFRAIYKEIFP